MKYPYIGINKAGTRTLFFSRANQFVISPGCGSSLLAGHNYNSIIPAFYENITHEYLQNTYGEVQSPEHAEFIIELAEANSFGWNDNYKGLAMWFSFKRGVLSFHESAQNAHSRGEKQITIPLPPKADKQELSEWPQVGDEVEFPSGRGVLALSEPDAQGVVIVKSTDEDFESVYKRVSLKAIKKPKTPEEELRDDIVWLTIKHMENKSYPIENNAYYLFSDLMGKYNITKKA